MSAYNGALTTEGMNIRIEDHVDTLNRHGRINDNPLPTLRRGDRHLLPSILIRNQGCNIRLDTTSTNTNNDNSSGIASDASRTCAYKLGQARNSQDEQTDHVDKAEDQNGLVATEVLVCDNGA